MSKSSMPYATAYLDLTTKFHPGIVSNDDEKNEHRRFHNHFVGLMTNKAGHFDTVNVAAHIDDFSSSSSWCLYGETRQAKAALSAVKAELTKMQAAGRPAFQIEEIKNVATRSYTLHVTVQEPGSLALR